MPIIRESSLPSSADQLTLPAGPGAKLFVVFISSKDAETGAPWCPDVRASWPALEAAFSPESAQKLVVVEVGQRPEWRDPNNIYRVNWHIKGVPTLARFELVDGKVTETGSINEDTILNDGEFKKFIK